MKIESCQSKIAQDISWFRQNYIILYPFVFFPVSKRKQLCKKVTNKGKKAMEIKNERKTLQMFSKIIYSNLNVYQNVYNIYILVNKDKTIVILNGSNLKI